MALAIEEKYDQVKQLIAMGPLAYPAVQTASTSSELEVAKRAQTVLKSLRDKYAPDQLRSKMDDFILSAEIMAITLGSIPESGLIAQAVILAVVGLGITVAVYGVVALIVKADDLGVAMAGLTWGPPVGGLKSGTGRIAERGLERNRNALILRGGRE